MMRNAEIERKTSETSVTIKLQLDGNGKTDISTTVPFLDHMLNLFARHGLFDLQVTAQGDTEIDAHHTVEDVGIVLGEAVKRALGDKQGIARYGTAVVPMDETLVAVTIDLSGRPYLVYHVPLPKVKLGSVDVELAREFFQAFANSCGCNLHLNLQYGDNVHHIIEACFKGFGRALDSAVRCDERVSGVLSTKGVL
ncbi:MAG: imidazoleglycerol-phosphate dehydratase HisB [Geobacter sp.]|nr:imidazoleglycerol-phosphate dehydratase HisB [Geobacter sp.]